MIFILHIYAALVSVFAIVFLVAMVWVALGEGVSWVCSVPRSLRRS